MIFRKNLKKLLSALIFPVLSSIFLHPPVKAGEGDNISITLVLGSNKSSYEITLNKRECLYDLKKYCSEMPEINENLIFCIIAK